MRMALARVGSVFVFVCVGGSQRDVDIYISD